MKNIVKISDFRNNISDYINRIIYKNESFLIKKGASIVAKVIFYNEKKEALSEEKINKYAGILKDEEAKEVKKYMDKFRSSFKVVK